MKTYTEVELKEIIALHKKWCNKEEGGKRADFTGAILTGVNLSRADLREAFFTGADLTGAILTGANFTGANFNGANFTDANLYRANFTGANLYRANFTGANLYRANFTGANLYRANFTGANLDLSSGIPFSCKGTGIIGDDRLFGQLVYHLTRQDWSNLSEEKRAWLENIPKDVLNTFLEYRSDLEEK